MEVQLRTYSGGLIFVPTLKEAFKIVKETPEIWKISFDVSSDERVRLVRTPNGWLYEPILLYDWEEKIRQLAKEDSY